MYSLHLSHLKKTQIASLVAVSIAAWLIVVGCGNFLPTRPLVQINGKDCVTYDPQTDYFPVKAKLNYAQGFQVSYHQHYKVVTVNRPYKSAESPIQYVLVQCGTPVPAGFSKQQVILIPVRSVIALSTTHLPHLERLELLDRLVGVANANLVYSPQIQARLKQKQIQEVSRNDRLDYEQIIQLQPDLITTFAIGNSQTDTHPKLKELGLQVVINAEYLEESPLGQAEWLKFTALFFNREAQAEQEFQRIAERYQQIAQLAGQVMRRPTVITGSHQRGTWYIAGGRSHVAQLLAAAGANYIFQADNSLGSIPLSFEAVFARGRTADVWLVNTPNWVTLEDVTADDPRYRAFLAFQKRQVFNNNRRVSAGGGNDYWESGILNPDLVLADLVKILHPELLPEHELVYFQKLE